MTFVYFGIVYSELSHGDLLVTEDPYMYMVDTCDNGKAPAFYTLRSFDCKGAFLGFSLPFSPLWTSVDADLPRRALSNFHSIYIYIHIYM